MLGRRRRAAFRPGRAGDDGVSARRFVLTALVFVLIGCNCATSWSGWSSMILYRLPGLGITVSAALIVSRFAWVFPAAWLPPSAVAGLK